MGLISKFNRLLCVSLVILFTIGCSSRASDLSSPELKPGADIAHSHHGSHQLWGLWQLKFDPSLEKAEAIPLRGPQFHMNVLPFLEPPPWVLLTIGNCKPVNHFTCQIDLNLTHPLAGLVEFTGFDVCGILFTNGTHTGFGDGITMAGWGDTRLVNADGYTRWWNPVEFPEAPFFGYTDGLIGAPNSKAHYNCNINGYKYYSDYLDPLDDIAMLPSTSRGTFAPGATLRRSFQIELGPKQLVMNYGIDACWEPPNGPGPWNVPDDFPEDANRSEPYRINAGIIDNSLNYDDYYGTAGGTATLHVRVYDWFHVEKNTITCRSDCGIPPVTVDTPIDTGPGYALYEIKLDGSSLTRNGPVDLLFECACEDIGYQDFLPGEPVTSYFTHSIKVGDPTPHEGWAITDGTTHGEYPMAVADDAFDNKYIAGYLWLSLADKQVMLIKLGSLGDKSWVILLGSEGMDTSTGIIVDGSGYIYLVGSFCYTVDFDPGPGVDEHTATGEGHKDEDAFLCKFDNSGNLVWAKTWGGDNEDNACALALDNYGYIYVAGTCRSEEADLNPDPVGESPGIWGSYVSKFSPSGEFQWSRSWGGCARDIAINSYNQVFVLGNYFGNVDFNPGPGASIYASHGLSDIYGSAFSQSGKYLGTKVLGGSGMDLAGGIAVDSSDNVYLSGTFNGQIDFDPGPALELQTAYSDDWVFLCKFHPDGSFGWASTWGATLQTDADYISPGLPVHNLDVDGLDNIYCVGQFRDIVDFDPGPGLLERIAVDSDYSFTSKFNSNGDFLWVSNWGGPNNATNISLVIDSSQNLDIVGSFSRKVDLNPGPEVEYFSYQWKDDTDIFLNHILPDGYW